MSSVKTSDLRIALDENFEVKSFEKELESSSVKIEYNKEEGVLFSTFGSQQSAEEPKAEEPKPLMKRGITGYKNKKGPVMVSTNKHFHPGWNVIEITYDNESGGYNSENLQISKPRESDFDCDAQELASISEFVLRESGCFELFEILRLSTKCDSIDYYKAVMETALIGSSLELALTSGKVPGKN